MRTLNSKLNRQMRFPLSSMKCSATPPNFRACGNQIAEHSSVNETVLGRSRKLGGATEQLIGGSEKRIFWLSLENFRVRILLKGEVKVAIF